MSPLHDPSFLAHFAQCKVSAKQQVNSMIDAIYAKVLLDLELWLNKHQSNDSIKSEIDSDSEENVTYHNNLPGQSQFDQSTEAANEVSLSNTINTESMIKQEFDDEEQDGENIVDDSVGKYEKRICTTGHDAEIGENGDEQIETQLNVDAPQENNQTNQSISSNDISPSPTNPNNTQPLIKQECLEVSSITSIPLDFTNNTALNDISTNGPFEKQNTQIQTVEFDDNDDDDDYYEGNLYSNEYMNEPICVNRVCDLDQGNKNNNHMYNDVTAGDETNLDEAQFQIDISDANNTQINNQNNEENVIDEKCVSEQKMEQSTSKQIQVKVFGDLVQSNVNSHNSGKRINLFTINDQVNESVKKAKRKQILDDDDEDQEEHATSAIATECTTNPIQPNRAQSNRHLQCSHCSKTFDRNSHLQRHLRRHTGERPFHCDQCEKRFRQIGGLTQHQLIHQNIKRFQCDQCDKQFTQKVNLESHLRTHSGERPHQCRLCDKSFVELGARERHEQAIHLHVKPYRCKQCGHTATHRSDIIVHIRVVHFGLPRTIKQQRALNIVDNRDPKEFIEKV